jgi:hypothetical protein
VVPKRLLLSSFLKTSPTKPISEFNLITDERFAPFR